MVKLDDSYKLVDALEPLGVPSLLACEEVKIEGPVRFGESVVLKGSVSFSAEDGEPKAIPGGVYSDGSF